MTIIVISLVISLFVIAGLMSAVETAITATSPGLIQKLKSEGNKRAELLLGILKKKEKVISTILIGNCIANTIGTTVATGLFIELLGDDLGTIVSSIVMSFGIIIFSEVIPKAIAVAKSEKIALSATPILLVVLRILEPVNILLAYIVKGFCHVFHIDLNQSRSAADEVRGMIEHHMHEGNVYKDDRDMLGGILDLRNMIIGDIMIHRSKMQAIDIDIPTDKIIKTVLSSAHSRIPFWQGNSDNIIGILHVKALMNKIYQSKQSLGEINIRELLLTPVFVPDNSLVVHQLNMFREGQTHLACVVDEYGDLQGIVTIEDILEVIVGRIYDEYDLGKQKITKLFDHVFIIDGSMPVRDLNRELNWQLPEAEATTIGGFIINKMAKIPNQGEYLIYRDLKMIVKKKFENRIKTIKIVLMSEGIDPEDPEII